MKAEGWMLLDGVELANWMRTLTYLRKGLGGGQYEVAVASPLRAGEGSGYSDVYSDVYGGDPYLSENLATWCALVDGGPYDRPAYDPAPWYDPARPESADFLGMWADIVILTSATRPLTARAGGGGNIGPVTVAPRIVQVSGTMFAASREGMEYGDRWLSRALLGADDCLASVLTLLPSCPPDGTDESYLREVAGAGLVDLPVFGTIQSIPACVMQTVSFQMGAADGYLRRARLEADEYLDATPAFSVDLTPAWATADAALVARVTAGLADLSGVSVDAGPLGAFEVDGLPAGETLVVDASLGLAYLDGPSGATTGGLDYVTFDGPFPWIVVPAGGFGAVSVTASGATGGAEVQLTVVDREL